MLHTCHIGGFLGAGKTTLLAAAAARLRARGVAVGVVTNDQAPGLVDTALLEREAASIGEVAGSCFCRDFHSFAREHERLKREGAQVILAEAVGSCTDLVATVLRPSQEKLGDGRVAPLTVVADPRRLSRVVLNPRRSNLHKSAAYIYVKQLEEAEWIVLNKVDTIDEAERVAIVQALEARFQNAQVLSLSALRGDGLEIWLDAVLNNQHDTVDTLDVDYDRYAEGEAVLGWLNATIALACTADREWDSWLTSFMERLQDGLPERSTIGHVKALLASHGAHLVANLVERGEAVVIRGRVRPGSAASLIVNARVELDPQALECAVRDALSHDAAVQTTTAELRCFRPSRPVPAYRSVGAFS